MTSGGAQGHGRGEDDDWALLRLKPSETLTDVFTEMLLATDTSVAGFVEHSIGFPMSKPDFDCATNVHILGMQDDIVMNQGIAYKQVVDVTNFSGDGANWKGDAMDGQSGSPVYHCSGGTCESGEAGRVDALAAGWIPSPTNRHSGPRIQPDRGTMLGIIDD